MLSPSYSRRITAFKVPKFLLLSGCIPVLHHLADRFAIYPVTEMRAAFYRPPGNPVLVGSDTFGRYQSGIPTHRYGGPAVATHISSLTMPSVKDTRTYVANLMAASSTTAHITVFSQGTNHGVQGAGEAKTTHLSPRAISITGSGTHLWHSSTI